MEESDSYQRGTGKRRKTLGQEKDLQGLFDQEGRDIQVTVGVQIKTNTQLSLTRTPAG